MIAASKKNCETITESVPTVLSEVSIPLRSKAPPPTTTTLELANPLPKVFIFGSGLEM